MSNLASLILTKLSFHGVNVRKHSKISHLYLLSEKQSLCNLFDAKIVWNWRLQIILSDVLYHWGHRQAVKVFFPLERKGLLEHTVDNEVSTLVRLTFYENLLIGQETSVRENVRGFLRDKENCPKRHLTRGPFIRGKIRRVLRVLNKTRTVPFIRACLI